MTRTSKVRTVKVPSVQKLEKTRIILTLAVTASVILGAWSLFYGVRLLIESRYDRSGTKPRCRVDRSMLEDVRRSGKFIKCKNSKQKWYDPEADLTVESFHDPADSPPYGTVCAGFCDGTESCIGERLYDECIKRLESSKPVGCIPLPSSPVAVHDSLLVMAVARGKYDCFI